MNEKKVFNRVLKSALEPKLSTTTQGKQINLFGFFGTRELKGILFFEKKLVILLVMQKSNDMLSLWSYFISSLHYNKTYIYIIYGLGSLSSKCDFSLMKFIYKSILVTWKLLYDALSVLMSSGKNRNFKCYFISLSSSYISFWLRKNLFRVELNIANETINCYKPIKIIPY